MNKGLRGKNGRFIKKIELRNVLLLIFAVALLGIPMAKAASPMDNPLFQDTDKAALITNQPLCEVTDTPSVIVLPTDLERMPTYDNDMVIQKTPIPTKAVTKRQTVNKQEQEINAIMRHVNAYKGKLTRAQVTYAYKKVGYHHTKVLVAISVAETGMGKKTRFKNNYWNYGMRSMSSVEASIDAVLNGLTGSYRGLVVNGNVNRSLAHCYVNGCKAKGNPPYTWIKTVEWSYIRM